MTQKNRIGCGWVVATFGVASAIWRVAGEKKPTFVGFVCAGLAVWCVFRRSKFSVSSAEIHRQIGRLVREALQAL